MNSISKPRTTVHFAKGPIIASIAAGPVFVISGAASALYLTLPRPIPTNVPDLFGVLISSAFIMLPAIVLGWFIAIVPCFAGTAALGNLGRVTPWVRLPLLWALVGGGVMAVPLLLFSDFGNNADALIFAFTAAGTVCALICRRFTVWER